MHSERKKIIKKLRESTTAPNKALEKRSKLTYPTILNFMKGRNMRQQNEEKLLKLSLDIIDECQKHSKAY